MARSFSGPPAHLAARPEQHQVDAVAAADLRVEEIKSVLATHTSTLAWLDEQAKPLKVQAGEQVRVLKNGLHVLKAKDESAVPHLLAVATDVERAWIERYMSELIVDAVAPRNEEATDSERRARIYRPSL